MLIASLIIDTRRASSRHENKYPIKIRVTERNGNTWKQKYFPINIYLHEKEFNRILSSPKTFEEEQQQQILQTHLNKAISLIRKVKDLNLNKFEQLYNGRNINSLNNYFELRIEQLKSEKRVGYATQYANTIASLKAYHGGELYFNEITPEFLKAYERHMRDNGKSITTVGMYLRAVRAVLNHAIQNHIINYEIYPFGKGKHKIKSERKIKIPLTLEQVEKLKAHTPTGYYNNRAKAFWMFSYYCNGMQLIDMLNLHFSDIQNGFIIFDRAKTRNNKANVRKIMIPYRDELKQIINQYGNRTLDPSAFIFDVLRHTMTEQQRKEAIRARGRRLNERLKKIGEDIDIPNLRMGIARHTFTNILLNAGISTDYLQYALGHSNITTTEHYKGSFAIDSINKASGLL